MLLNAISAIVFLLLVCNIRLYKTDEYGSAGIERLTEFPFEARQKRGGLVNREIFEGMQIAKALLRGTSLTSSSKTGHVQIYEKKGGLIEAIKDFKSATKTYDTEMDVFLHKQEQIGDRTVTLKYPGLLGNPTVYIVKKGELELKPEHIDIIIY